MKQAQKQQCQYLKNLLKKPLKKDARPFKTADNIALMVIDKQTGKKASFTSKENNNRSI